MNTFEPNSPGGDQVAFFGRITASVTHELNNVLSIIDQNAGLLDDLVAGEERGIPMSIERVAQVSTTVQKQTQRGLQIIGRLNRFAHSTDHCETVFDLNEVLDNLIGLIRRLAALKQVDLEFRAGADLPKMTGNPFDLQRVVFELVTVAVPLCRPGTRMIVETAAEQGSVLVTAVYEAEAEPDARSTARVTDSIRSEGGEVTVSQLNGTTHLSLRLPMRSSR